MVKLLEKKDIFKKAKREKIDFSSDKAFGIWKDRDIGNSLEFERQLRGRAWVHKPY